MSDKQRIGKVYSEDDTAKASSVSGLSSFSLVPQHGYFPLAFYTPYSFIPLPTAVPSNPPPHTTKTPPPSTTHLQASKPTAQRSEPNTSATAYAFSHAPIRQRAASLELCFFNLGPWEAHPCPWRS